MKLAFQKSGSGKALVILHGLYGSSDNWQTLGRALSAHFTVYLVDQRNHGRSPHDPVHTYDAMCDDLDSFLTDNDIRTPILLGHSMGGKTAMRFAMQYPHRVGKLVVVDISPAGYGNKEQKQLAATHEKIVSAMQLIDPLQLGSRKEADSMLAQSVPQSAVRQFLLKNLKTGSDGKYRWELNLNALTSHMESIAAGILDPGNENPEPVPVPSLFIKGEKSPYLQEEDIRLIARIFPRSRLVTIPDAGHWVHAEQPGLFMKALLEFLQPDLQS